MSIWGNMAKKNEEEKKNLEAEVATGGTAPRAIPGLEEVSNLEKLASQAKTPTMEEKQREMPPAAAEQEKTAPHPQNSAVIFNRVIPREEKNLVDTLKDDTPTQQQGTPPPPPPPLSELKKTSEAASETKPSLTLDEPQLSQGKSGIVEQLEQDPTRKEPKQDLSLAGLDEMHEKLQEDTAGLIVDIQDTLLGLADRLKPVSRPSSGFLVDLQGLVAIPEVKVASPVFKKRIQSYNVGLKNKRDLIMAKHRIQTILTNLDY